MRRAFLQMTLAVDLDAVPGFGHQPEDWEAFIRHELGRAQHYRPDLIVHTAEVRPYRWDDRDGWIAPEPPAGEQETKAGP